MMQHVEDPRGNVLKHKKNLQKCWENMASFYILQGGFFNWPSPEFAKCWPLSNWFQKNLESQTGHIALEGPVR